MRVVIGLRSLFPGKVGGLETYVRELLKAWGNSRRDDEWIVLVNPEAANSFTSPGPWLRFEVVSDVHDLLAWKQAAEKHAPALYFSPMLVIDPPDVGLPCVVNIPDMQHIYYPHFFDAETLRFRRLHYPLSARRAQAVLTLSAHAKSNIVEKLGVPEGKVHGILLAAGEQFGEAASADAVASIREKYRLPEGFGFFPANFWPHKNHGALFAALALHRRQNGDMPHVALSGFAGDNLAGVEAAIREHGLESEIHILGYLPVAELPLLYQAAGFLVFPSLFEGFGIPVAEAMASGCPVITSNATSLPELAGDAALYFDPGDPAELAERIHALHSKPELRTTLIAKGRARSVELNWRRTADETYQVLKTLDDRLRAESTAPTVVISLDESGRINPDELPPADPAPVLCFSPPGSPPDPASWASASLRFRGSGLAGILATAASATVPAAAPAFDILRLRSEDYIPLEWLWVGPLAAPPLLDWLRRNPRPAPYEIALRVALSGSFADDPGLGMRRRHANACPATPSLGVALSWRYFGVVDERWIERLAESRLGLFTPLLVNRHRTRRLMIQLQAAWLRWRLYGELPPEWRKTLLARFGRATLAAPMLDGWIAQMGVVKVRRPADGQLRLVVESPAWPYARPLHLRVLAGQQILFNGPLPARGIYRFEWPWPGTEADTLKLRLLCSDTFVPALHGLGNDQRQLSLRVLTDKKNGGG